MALRGTINGKVTQKSNYFSFYLTWSATQNVSENYSDVTVNTYWKTSSTYETFDTDGGTRSASITVDGTTKSISKAHSVFWSSNPYLIQSETFKVKHNSDGTKSIKISARANGYAKSYGPSSSISSSGDCTVPETTITLDKISTSSSNVAKVTSADNFTDENNPTITFTNKGNNIVQPYLNFYKDGTRVKQITREKEIWASPFTFTLTSDERNELRELYKDMASCSVTLGLNTFVSNESIGYHSLTRTFSIVNANPSTSMTLAPSGCPSWAYVSSKPIYIQGVTKVGATFSNTFKKKATQKSNTLTVEGYSDSSSPYESNVLVGSGTIKVEGKATDSRGLTGTTSQNITVIPYSKPYVARNSQYDRIICERCDVGGNHKDNGTYLHVVLSKKWSPLTNNTNKAKLEYRITSTGFDSGWISLSETTQGTNGSYNINTILSKYTLAVDKAYTIDFRCTDTFGNYTTTAEKAAMEEVTFHLKEGGGGAAFGEYAEEEKVLKLKDDWEFKLKGMTIEEFIKKNGGLNTIQVIAQIASTISSTFDDYVIDRGTTDATNVKTNTGLAKDTIVTWTWEKWKSGLYKCWAKMSVTANFEKWGNAWCSQKFQLPNFPITLMEIPQVNVCWNGNSASGTIYGSHAISTSFAGYTYLVRPAETTTLGGYISIEVIGKWE